MNRPAGRSAPVHTLGVLDAGWLLLESASNLMHGGILCVFDPPPDAGPRFVHHLVDDMRRYTTPVVPFNRKLKRSGLGRLWPQWETVDHIDPDRHVYHYALPALGDERDLGVLISQLQGIALNKADPLWTFHVIEGLPDGRFAIFGRMHHALADGVAALGFVDAWLSDDPASRDMPPMWAASLRRNRSRPTSDPHTPKPGWSGRGLPAVVEAAARMPADALAMIGDLRTTPRRMVGAVRAVYRAAGGVSARPWSAPRTTINTPITAHRRVATESYDLGRFSAVAERAGGTINDVVLAMCSGGLRRYLADVGTLPTQPLITNIPVSVRRVNKTREAGNSISWAMVSLATDVDDVRQRFDTIRSATGQAKKRLQQLGDTIDTYTLLVTTPILLEQVVGLGGHLPPMFNIPISNVPGPRTAKYLNGARLREIYALTVLYGAQALNTVAVSYAGWLNFSFTACGDSLPHVQRLAVFCREALEELEQTYATEPDPSRRGRARRPRKSNGHNATP
jgi:diacylglycerol O-acyltransferase